MKDGQTLSTRAGRYVRQPSGYRAFIPEALPPKPPVRITDQLQRLLSEADRGLGRLDGSIQILPAADMFVFMYVRKEAVLSSQIEGTQSSLQDLLAEEAKILTPNRPKDVAQVINYVSAMNYGLERLSTLPVSTRLICEIHGELLKGVRGSHLTPGEVRTSQNWIGPEGCTLLEANFVPPPPSELAEAMSSLEQFIHCDTELPPLIKIGLVHAQFETIHPFRDGNGRVGRLLITFLLCQQRILTQPVLYLSYFFKRRRQQYYDELQAVRDAGSWEKWLAFFLRGVVTVSEQSTDTVQRILALRESHRRVINDNFGRAAGNGHRVLEHIFSRPVVSVDDVQELIGTTYQTANNLVARLVEHDILREFTGQARNRAFIYQRYLDLFHETGQEDEV
ncbi:MAG: Fic family protein [Caldilineaceae bacterium SB0661_bin_32]|uniref:Fic family protein n=1 Tax=Caldilineaceae bacterium SB0661_bin_32 TaxID=2605255 RepID=A0A6B1D611_9CHLR|nr:Fic family protein [Caldilineaceae bacterium SB0661_bin_32]